MIEYDYILKKNVKSRVDVYAPSFPKKINNIAKIKGHNSSGKSTLQSLIALSSFGLTDYIQMNPKLKKKLEILYNEEYIEFDFSMTVTNETGRILKFHSIKENKDLGKENKKIEVEESTNNGINFKKLTKEQFCSKYRLIYDMPDRPMERVKELVKEINEVQKECSNKITSLRDSLSKLNKTVRESKDENTINAFISKKENLENELKEKYKIKNLIQSQYDSLFYYYTALKIKNTLENYKRADLTLQNINNNIKKSSTAEKKAQKEYELKVEAIKKHKLQIKDDRLIFIKSFEKIKKDIKIDSIDIENWYNYNIELENEMKLSNDYLNLTKKIKMQIEVSEKKLDIKNDLEKQNVLEKIINLLDNYSTSNISILDHTPNELCNQLKTELKEIQEKATIQKHILDLKDCLNSCISATTYINDLYCELGPKPTITEQMDITLYENKCEDSKKKYDDAIFEGRKINILENNYIEMINNYTSDPKNLENICLNESQISAKLEKQQSEIKKIMSEIESENGLNSKINYLNIKIKDHENKEPHKLIKYHKELTLLEEILKNMQTTLSHKNTILSGFIDENKSLSKTNMDNDYLNLIWKDLGRRYETIYYVKKLYYVESVNLINNEILSKDGTIIRFDDMGTGESQNAYLMGLLNSNENKIIIALFDEVDHMDNSMIEVIQKKFKELYDADMLMIGLMAAPGNNPEVENYD